MTIDFTFDSNAPHTMDGIEWSILVGKDGDRVQVIEHPDVGMLFPEGGIDDLLFPVYPTTERVREPDEIEITVCVGTAQGKTDGPDWDSLAEQMVRESGKKTTSMVLLHKEDIEEFCDAASLEMAQNGECRLVEFRLGDAVIAKYVSSGDTWFYLFFKQETENIFKSLNL